MAGYNKKSNTGYKGITFVKGKGTYEVSISMRINPRQKKSKVYVGVTPTLPEALKLRQDFIQQLF